jgi:hypothetical protein
VLLRSIKFVATNKIVFRLGVDKSISAVSFVSRNLQDEMSCEVESHALTVKAER